MGFKPVVLAGTAVLGLGNLLHIIGLATHEWVILAASKSPFGVEITSGLWKICSADECVDNVVEPDWLEASRAFAILGMLAGLTAILSAVIVFVLGLMDKDSLGGPVSVKILGIATLAMAGASLVLILLSVIVFGAEIKEDSSDYEFGYSFGLCITGALLIGAGGGIVLAGSL